MTRQARNSRIAPKLFRHDRSRVRNVSVIVPMVRTSNRENTYDSAEGAGRKAGIFGRMARRRNGRKASPDRSAIRLFLNGSGVDLRSPVVTGSLIHRAATAGLNEALQPPHFPAGRVVAPGP